MNTKQNGLIVRSADPINLEMPFSELDSFVTPNEQFYVRCHFPIPEISARDWRLRVEGAVTSPFELGYDELRQSAGATVTATMECAGNGRSLLEPKAKGVPWGIGAVGNATWTGVPLRELLQRAGIRSSAVEIILEGTDRGPIGAEPRPPGEIHYARSLPIGKATQDVLLAWAMNGETLTPSHGFPLRAIVPGWFGMASVKWLKRIVITEIPFNGYYQSIDYAYWAHRDGLTELRPLREMQVKAQIARPAMNEELQADVPYRVHGAAWAAADEVVKVELSTDGGVRWEQARLLSEPVRNAWRLWEFPWRTPAKPGSYTLVARATDSAGHTQPQERLPEYATYMVNHWLRVPVEVR